MRVAILLAAALLGVPAAAWYFATEGETLDAEHVPSVARSQGGDPEPSPKARDVATKFRPASGLQTTVPDTVGYDEQTAIFALEEGGFRVRVMTRKVSDPGDEGIVVQQLPRGGLTRRLNWIVTIVVGRLR
jgi:hypothetical protein